MAIAGLRGSGNFGTEERPTNYRGVLLLLKPNTKAPLTALSGQMRSEATDDPEFNVFTKGLPVQRATVSGSHNTTITTITLQDSSQDNSIFKVGHAVINERTGEVMWVTAKSSTTAVVVDRAQGSSAAAMNAADGLLILGSTYAENADVPAAVTYDPSLKTNYTQIFRNSLNLSGTAMATRLRHADNPKAEYKREVLELHAIEMEKQFFFGSGVEDNGSTSSPQRTTKGLFFWIATNITDFSDAVDIDTLENALEDLFENGSSEKMLFCGNRLLNVINKAARIWGNLQIMPTTETFGMRVVQWTTPYGDLMLRQHPLFSANATFNDWGFAVDLTSIIYRYLRGRDTQYLENRQSPGVDGQIDEFMTECGLECQFEETHQVLKNASAFVP